jgi:HSP20 family protein
MALARWDPSSDLVGLHREIDRIFGETLGSDVMSLFGDIQPALAAPVDIHRDGDSLRIEASLPGFAPNEVRVTADSRRLVIEAEKRKETHQRDKSCLRHERYEGRIYREIPLPEGADVANAKAGFENGVLKITLPVSNRSQSRDIPVSAGGSNGNGGRASAQDLGGTVETTGQREQQPQTTGAGGQR